MKNKENKVLKYFLKSIKKEKVFIGNIDIENSQILIGCSLLRPSGEDDLLINVSVRIINPNDQSENNIFAELTVNFIFEIYGLSKIENNGSINLPDDFIISLLGLAYSTSRGILFEMTNNNFILPIIDPGILLKQLKSNKTNTPE